MNIKQMWDILIVTVAVAGIGSAIPPSTMIDIVRILGGVALLAGVVFVIRKRVPGRTPVSSEC